MIGTLSRTRWRIFAVMLFSLLTGSMQAQPGSLATGIEGVISVSPIHGGPSRLGEKDSAPLANVAFDVVNDTTVVTSFTTDAAGKFRVSLPPGHYSIRQREKKKIGGCGTFQAEVTAAGFAKVHLDCDTGIR